MELELFPANNSLGFNSNKQNIIPLECLIEIKESFGSFVISQILIELSIPLETI